MNQDGACQPVNPLLIWLLEVLNHIKEMALIGWEPTPVGDGRVTRPSSHRPRGWAPTNTTRSVWSTPTWAIQTSSGQINEWAELQASKKELMPRRRET